MDMQQGSLSGFRILELGNLIATPHAGRLFAGFGAEAIKVERPRTGDELRQWRLYRGDTSLFWSLQARNNSQTQPDARRHTLARPCPGRAQRGSLWSVARFHSGAPGAATTGRRDLEPLTKPR